ncbi:MBL fold metallo-hydrolase [Halorhabdus amylolytica]|uniref:MBL fold metallo-hydrolase n=1 Tax=Halorhabdus amylolytica TaxID=2559573 RepID=UPI0010AABC71|nr:MBL fold metallo-hydrolase [Halorhabdus amylolytica]
MQVSYQHANPNDGRESFLLRFDDKIHDQKTCILVDAGERVNLDDILAEDEYLSGICLTHAHLDHYRTLGSNLRDGAPIYATPETAQAITTRLDTEAEHADLGAPDDVREALEPITDWTRITNDVRIHPVPAGHAPGASGFVVQFSDGNDRHHLLATGDFTRRRAAGYPGIQTDLPVDAVFLTGATNSTFRDQLTSAVRTVIERATAGSTVLTTASGSNGVHLAYLLSHIGDTTETAIPVTVAGRVGTLWDAFEYDHPAVESVPTFENTEEILGPGRVTIAGPEVPVSGSSERLFEAIEDDEGATLVQVTSGAFEPERSAVCTVDAYEVSNHPREVTIDAVVEDFAPIHVVVTHQCGHSADRYKDKYDSFVWATDDRKQYTLYDGEWSGPPWVTDATRRRVRSRLYRNNGSTVGRSFDNAEVPLPTVDRHDDIDLEAEGIDMERLAEDRRVGSALTETQQSFESDTNATDGTAVTDGEPSDSVAEDGSNGSASTFETIEEPEIENSTQDPASLDEIIDRLDRIENEVTGTRTRATVVDAGDDVTLLRLEQESLETELTHGQSIGITLHGNRMRVTSRKTGSSIEADDA